MDGSHSCSRFASCVDVPGSFQCTCQTGYTGDGVSCIKSKSLLRTLNYAEYHLKNYGDRRNCYPLRLLAEADDTLRDA